MNTHLQHTNDNLDTCYASTNQFTTSEGSPLNGTLQLWWQHVLQIPLLTSEREIVLGKRIAKGDQTAYQELVESNLRLVANIARKSLRFSGQHLSLEDLIQEGCMGLMRAAQKFDWRRGYKFSTYASYWIRQAIFRAVADQGRSIRLPVHMVESISRVDRAKAILTQQMQRPPSHSELSAYLSLPEKKLTGIVECVNEPLSLDVYANEDEESTLLEQIQDNVTKPTTDQANSNALRDEVKRAIRSLPKREATVLELHFGLNDQKKALTLDEVGSKLNLTRERIRQIEKDALLSLQKNTTLSEMVIVASESEPEPEPALDAKLANAASTA